MVAPPDAPLPPGCGPTVQAVQQLDAALMGAQAQFGVILKDADNPYFKSSYVSLPGLLALVRPILRDHHVMISSSYQLVSGVGFVVSTTVTHVLSGGWRVSTFPVHDPSKPQSVGAAGTYGMRLSLLQLLAISGEDDDGNAATTGAPITNAVPVAQWGIPAGPTPVAQQVAPPPQQTAPAAPLPQVAPAAWDPSEVQAMPAPGPGDSHERVWM